MGLPSVIQEFVRAASAGDADAAARCVTDDATFVLPGGRRLPDGEAGARAFALKHAESEGRKPLVELLSAEQMAPHRWVAALRFEQRDSATGETLYEMTVGGIFEVRADRISRHQAFPSPQEAAEAAAP